MVSFKRNQFLWGKQGGRGLGLALYQGDLTTLRDELHSLIYGARALGMGSGGPFCGVKTPDHVKV